MKYIQNTLLKDEKLLYYTGPHLVIFSRALLCLFLGVILFLSSGSLKAMHIFNISLPNLFGNILLFLALIYGLLAYITYISSEYGITNKRVLMKVGFIRRNSLEIFLHKIESVYVEQSLFGRIFNYGVIVIAGTGGSKDPFPFIPNPLLFRRKVQEQIEKMNNEDVVSRTQS